MTMKHINVTPVETPKQNAVPDSGDLPKTIATQVCALI
jgi:hypothetical protein